MSGCVLRLLRVGITVADLPRMQAFYQDALGFAPVGEATEADPAWARLLGTEGARMRTARLRLGAQEIELAAFDPAGQQYPPGSTAADLWFQHIAIVTNDMAAAYVRLGRHRAVPITEGGPQRLPPAAGGVTAYKFRDPEGHPLELIHFPPASGDPAWRRAASVAVTLGYDHSAISVAEVDRSAAFYGLLGLEQASRQLNSGAEQERLDGLPEGDVVDVVAMRPAAAPTPHLELLAYRTPRGRPAPLGSLRSQDVAAARLVMQVEDLPSLLRTLAASGVPAASPDPVSLPDGSRATLVRDPDGHALVLVEQAAAP